MLKIRAKYFFKRFSLYLIYGIISAILPLLHMSVLFGLPAILVCSIALALTDCLNIKDAENVPKVYTKVSIIGIGVLAITVILIVSSFIYFHR